MTFILLGSSKQKRRVVENLPASFASVPVIKRLVDFAGQPAWPGECDGVPLWVSGARHHTGEHGRHQAEGSGQVPVSSACQRATK